MMMWADIVGTKKGFFLRETWCLTSTETIRLVSDGPFLELLNIVSEQAGRESGPDASLDWPNGLHAYLQVQSSAERPWDWEQLC